MASACQPHRRSRADRTQARCGAAVRGWGGLLSGVVEGLQRNGWDHTPVIAVETEGTASVNAALQAGHPVELDSIRSVATSAVVLQMTALARQHTANIRFAGLIGLANLSGSRSILRVVAGHADLAVTRP